MKEALTFKPGQERHLPIVTGFLGRGLQTGAITTLGRGGSDLTCTLLGASLGLPEVQVSAWSWAGRRRGGDGRQSQPAAPPTSRPPRHTCLRPALTTPPHPPSPSPPYPPQVWKDVDGVLTADPRVVEAAAPVSRLTFEEATELAVFGATVLHPLAMQPAHECNVGVRVKNSYNRTAPGTLITEERDMSDVLVTSIVCKSNVTLVDVTSSRMMGQYGFLSKASPAAPACAGLRRAALLGPRRALWGGLHACWRCCWRCWRFCRRAALPPPHPAQPPVPPPAAGV